MSDSLDFELEIGKISAGWCAWVCGRVPDVVVGSAEGGEG